MINGRRLGESEEAILIRSGDEVRLGDLIFFVRKDFLEPQKEMPGFGLQVEELHVASSSRTWLGLRSKVSPIFVGLSFALEPNQLLGITGPSGCGKTTLLRILGGMEKPHYGRVWLDNLHPAKAHPDIAYLPQDDILSPFLTVQETFLHNAVIKKISYPRWKSDRVIEYLGLVSHKTARIKELSGGQRKRVSIGIELLKKPRLFLLDEPTSGLDSENVAKIYQLLSDFRKLGVTIVLISHIREEFRYLDLMLQLDQKGNNVYFGSPPGHPDTAVDSEMP